MPIDYPVHNAAPLVPIKRPNVTACGYDSIPAMKRPRFSSPSQTDFNGRLNNGMLNFSPYHASSDNIAESSRLRNIRFVSVTSMHLAMDMAATAKRESSVTSNANYSSSSDGILGKRQAYEPILDCDLLALNSVNGSWSSGVASIKLIHETIQNLLTTIGTDMQTQLIVADQCYRLATWTKINTSSFDCKNSRPTSTSNLTLHQVALAIVSYNGINVVLNAMSKHPNNIEIQECGCMVLGNVLAILYRRNAGIVLTLERYLSENTKQMGKTIFNQIIQAMRNHPINVAIHCAAVPALQSHYLSVLSFRPNESMLECQDIVLRNAHELLLPSKVRQILRTTTSLAERFKNVSC